MCQIPCSLIYMWNPNNKINQQTKKAKMNVSKHFERQQLAIVPDNGIMGQG